MRNIWVVATLAGILLFSACSSSSKTTPTSTAETSTRTPVITTSTPAVAATVPEPDASAAAVSFPQRCTQLVSNADVDALALQHLQLATDNVVAVSGATSQLVCRFQGAGTGADTALIVVANGYADAATAHDEDSILRTTAQAQGGTFTTLNGLADEAYAFTYPALTGVAARKRSRSVSVGVGKLLGAPQPTEFTPIIEALLGKLGS